MRVEQTYGVQVSEATWINSLDYFGVRLEAAKYTFQKEELFVLSVA